MLTLVLLCIIVYSWDVLICFHNARGGFHSTYLQHGPQGKEVIWWTAAKWWKCSDGATGPKLLCLGYLKKASKTMPVLEEVPLTFRIVVVSEFLHEFMCLDEIQHFVVMPNCIECCFLWSSVHLCITILLKCIFYSNTVCTNSRWHTFICVVCSVWKLLLFCKQSFFAVDVYNYICIFVQCILVYSVLAYTKEIFTWN